MRKNKKEWHYAKAVTVTCVTKMRLFWGHAHVLETLALAIVFFA